MKVLFVIDSLEVGGKERQLLYLVENLSFDFKIITFSPIIGFTEFNKFKNKIIVLKKYSNYDLRVLWKIYAIYREDNYIIHTWDFVSAFYIALLRIFSNKIVHINGAIRSANLKIKMLTILKKIRIKFILRNSNCIISNSKAGLISLNLFEGVNVKVIYNGFPRLSSISILTLDLKSKLNIPPDSIIIVMVANFNENKDYLTFLQVATKLIANDKNLHFICVGDGKYLKYYLNEFNNRNIHFLGRRLDIYEINRNIDIGVLLSNVEEGLSNTILEYMYASKPVIATKLGGNYELLEEGINGFLVQPRDEDDFYNKLLILIKNKDLRLQMGKHSKQITSNKFNLEKYVSSYETLYSTFT